MKLSILDIDRLIEVNKLQPITTGRILSTRMTFDPEGLLSTDIFGVSKAERTNTFAYIDLKRPFVHPHIYAKVLKRVDRNVVQLISGRKRFSVVDGVLKEDPDNGWTGIAGLYDHWEEIKWENYKSTNKLNKSVLSQLPKNLIFVDKFLVSPPAYRDVTLAGTVDSSDHVNELNKLYQQIISLVSNLSDGGLFARTQYASQMKIQDVLVEILEYFQGQIAKKQGLIRRYLVGKSIDFGSRAVISAANYNNERFEDNMIDMEHVALPISQCCSNFYPFIESYLRNFFTREIINDPNLITYHDPVLKRDITATLKDPEIQFSDRNIKKMINNYCLNPDNRFQPITVDVLVPGAKKDEVVKASMILKGKIFLDNNVSKELNRPMTVTDILYLACVDVCEGNRHVEVSRYPVGTDKGIYFNKIRVQSTADHVKVIFNGKEYPWWPKIDLKLEHDKVGVQFVDTLVMSNAHLDGMGADFDGDILSVRGIWSDEANLEAEEIMNKKTSALNITGSNAKTVSKEVVNSFYELTKIADGAKKLGEAATREFLELTPSDITRSKLAEWFADFVNNSSGTNKVGKHKSRFNTWDTIEVPANYFYKDQPAMTTTVGKFIANKFVLESTRIIGLSGFVSDVLNKKGLGNLDDKVGHMYLKDQIDRKQFNEYVDRRDTLGYWLNGMLAHSISERMLKPLPEIEKKKAELFKKYEKELSSGNVDVMTKVSNELIAYAKEILKDDPGMDLYTSGDLDFGNNYRNNAILRGAVINKLTGEFDFIGTSLMGGIDVKDIPAHANSILASQYPASIATADAGYLSKKLLALLQMTELDVDGSDCGTKNLIPIKITKFNSSNMLYRYIDNGAGQLIMLDEDNISKYIGKRVMMRSPMSCISDKICSKCAGKLFYYMDITFAGLFGVQISHSDLNAALKSKHNSVVDIYTMNPDELIQDIM